MRTMLAAMALMASGWITAPANAFIDTVPPFKGNDTGGIISYNLVGQADIKAMAVNHCASYGKIVKPLAVQANYGGYISFACVWVPPGGYDRPLRARY